MDAVISYLQDMTWAAVMLLVFVGGLLLVLWAWLFITQPLRWKWGIVRFQPNEAVCVTRDEWLDNMRRFAGVAHHYRLVGNWYFVWRDGWRWWWTTDGAKE